MTEQMEPNVPLLRKMVEWVEEQAVLPADTRSWWQSSWVTDESFRTAVCGHKTGCGTAYCAAGYVAQLVDERFKESAEVVTPGKILYASDVADRALGIEGVTHHMWYAGNSAGRIREEAERLAGGRL